MFLQKEENNRPFKPQIHQKKRRGQNQQNFGDRDRNRPFSRDRQRQNFRPNYRRHLQDRRIQHGHENRRGSYRHQHYNNRGDSRDRGRENFRRNFSNDRNDNRDRNRSRTRERSLTPRRNDRRYNSPNTNLGTRNRSTSRVTMNRDRVRCYRSREYDHIANICPNAVTDDSDGYESDRATLQLITAEAEMHNFEQGTGLIKLIKGKKCYHFIFASDKERWMSQNDSKMRYIPNKENECLTKDQARHVYKMVEKDKVINTETLKQEIENNKLTRNRIKEEDNIEENPYQMAILNKVSSDDIKTEEMIHWSILSDLIKYIDGSSSSDMTPSLTAKPLDYSQHKRLYHSLKSDKDLTTNVIFEGDKVKDEYFDK